MHHDSLKTLSSCDSSVELLHLSLYIPIFSLLKKKTTKKNPKLSLFEMMMEVECPFLQRHEAVRSIMQCSSLTMVGWRR